MLRAQPLQVATIEWQGDRLDVIDQTLLPERVEVRSLRSATDVVGAIKALVVRGAPAIGVCGAFGVVLGLQDGAPDSTSHALALLDEAVRAVGEARPTAANLAWAAGRVAAAARRGSSPDEIRRLALDEALRIRDNDIESCNRIGEVGRIELAGASHLLTHCNAGRLCAAGIGTALGIVYAKAAAGEPVEVVACETRPLLQGGRLTAWELAEAGIPVTVIPDGAAGAALAAGMVDAVVVGCDRVAGNGDTANKIGTYALAVLALAHEVPFYVAGPMTTFDAATAGGEGIVIEQRSGDEVRRVGTTVVAPDVAVWNPAFDVTPAGLVTAFITDAGVLRPPYEVSIRDGIAEAARLGLRDP
ncbi:MAG: methylthioribose-phosphate isomerase [Actinomycetota bacterium]|jgi:methylthioribose-1-phosphate isomerase|nr:methylthioribose-phosphate isomerase [Actinomycetota bacterium]